MCVINQAAAAGTTSDLDALCWLYRHHRVEYHVRRRQRLLRLLRDGTGHINDHNPDMRRDALSLQRPLCVGCAVIFIVLCYQKMRCIDRMQLLTNSLVLYCNTPALQIS